VIRFSAALVAVAIGVLIGGIATSKLLLVYIAIVVSAVALVALAIGVVLKREELFREVQGLAPAAAGAGPVLQARTGESAGESQHKVPVGAHVAPPPPFQGAAGGYTAAFGGTAPAASSSAGAGSSAARPAAAGQGRQAEPVPPWDTSAARGPWSSPTPDWVHSGQDERTASAAGGAGGRASSAWEDTTPAPRSWAAPSSPSASADAPAVKPGAGPGAAAPSWFDRLGGQTGAPPTVAAPTVASPAAPGAAGSGDAASGDAGAGDEDDDWPTRYSWLEDTDEGGEAAETVATPVAGAAPESKSPVPAGTAADAGPEDVAAGTTADAGASAAETVAAPALDAGDADAAHGPDADPASVNAAAAAESDADIIAFPSPGEPDLASDPDAHDPHDGLAGESGAGGAGEAGHAAAATETGSEPPATAEDDAAPGTDLVSVVPGVPRYHRTDCVLIRFMAEGDVQKQSVAAARDAGCTPCAACQPEG
jgi:hypothetical protein